MPTSISGAVASELFTGIIYMASEEYIKYILIDKKILTKYFCLFRLTLALFLFISYAG
jgi:hypothetical protein